MSIWQEVLEQFERDNPAQEETSVEAQEESVEEGDPQQEPEGSHTGTEEEPTEEEVPEEEQSGSDTGTKQEQPEEKEPETPPREHQGWARLRKERDEYRKYYKFLDDLAKTQGLTVDQLMEKVNQTRVQAEAQQKGVDPEVWQEIRQIREDNERMKKEAAQTAYFSRVQQFMTREGLTDKDLESTWAYMAEKGYYNDELGVPTLDIEELYFLANRDRLVQEQVKKARQKELAEKRRRQKTAPVPHGGGAAPQPIDSDELTDEEFWKISKQLGVLKDRY